MLRSVLEWKSEQLSNHTNSLILLMAMFILAYFSENIEVTLLNYLLFSFYLYFIMNIRYSLGQKSDRSRSDRLNFHITTTIKKLPTETHGDVTIICDVIYDNAILSLLCKGTLCNMVYVRILTHVFKQR